jgi:hypothetical protein
VRKLAVFATLFAAVAVTGFGMCPNLAVAQNPWQQSTLNENKMSIEVGAKVFDRGSDATGALVVDTTTGSTLLSNQQATDFGSSFGAEVKLNFPGMYDRGVEVRAVIGNWDQDFSVAGATLGSTFFPDPLNPPTTFDYGIESDYFSIEVMRKRSVRPGLTIFGGPRFVSTSDEINAAASQTVAGTIFTQSNDFEAKNSMMGLQGGIEICRPISQAVYASGFVRGGGYFNPTEFNTSDTSATTGVVTRTRQRRSSETFIGEAGGRLHFEILPNCLASYVGYEATWIDGIALASANVGNLGAIDTHNTIFFHAVTFGVNLSY